MLECVSPIDGSVYATRPTLSRDAAAAVAATLQGAQQTWAARPLEERAALVMKGVARLGEMTDEVVPELAWMMGRPVRYGGEFSGVLERAGHMADIAAEALKPLVVEDSDAFERRILREPLGVIFVISPWNYPYLTAINTVAPALIAGNTVMIKGSTQTLLATERLARTFHEAGVPEEVFQNVFLDHRTTEALIGSGALDYVNFTGSVGAGRAIERAAAGTFTPVGLELGGKDPGYVMADADPEAAAETLIDAAMFNSGQCCCGIERIYVHESLWQPFLDKSVSIVEGYVLGNPLDPETTLGPMASRRFADLVRGQTDAALAAGARGLIDGSAFADDGGTYLAPQILVDVTHDMAVMRDESFGPVVRVMPVASDDEAVALMNDSDFGLTAALMTRDPERAAAIAGQLQTGTVFMNRADYLDPALCWTGCKDTGRGGALSVIGYHNLTRPKSLHFRKG
ncbi:MAG: aldehyde dehydrogenase family protein [Dinoroseobacter sp.]|nr:aldehyde dehydrogenase family protein [Dinoroseobacter sp.]